MARQSMARRLVVSLALAVTALMAAAPAHAISEADRLWLVGERAFQDGLAGLSRRNLERFIERFPSDPRVPEATLLLGRACLAAGDPAPALDALRRAAGMTPPPGKLDEARFWEAEAVFRMKRYPEARALFERISADPGSPFAGDALYGVGWSELELKRPEAALRAFARLIETAPGHASVPAARVQLARTAIALKKYDDAASARGRVRRDLSRPPPARRRPATCSATRGRPPASGRASRIFAPSSRSIPATS